MTSAGSCPCIVLRVGYHVEEVGRPSFEDVLAGL
jgi:hypothetical protein